MGVKVRKKKSFIFLSLRVQKCILVTFFRKIFRGMDILHIVFFKKTSLGAREFVPPNSKVLIVKEEGGGKCQPT
jgi:hypothetical protein